MDVGFKKKTTVSQTLFEFGRKRNLKDNEMEDILQVPSFKRLANDFDVNIKAGLQNPHPIVLMRIFVQRRDPGAGVRAVKTEEKVQANIPIFGTDYGQGDVMCKGCRPVIEVVCKGRLVYRLLMCC